MIHILENINQLLGQTTFHTIGANLTTYNKHCLLSTIYMVCVISMRVICLAIFLSCPKYFPSQRDHFCGLWAESGRRNKYIRHVCDVDIAIDHCVN